ncbi:MAG TPA: PrsW family glutamic-type intramembrane protease [Anaerolineales bacterium]|nr:PrsW family glutamic-type intramembrane protease [Anaerolineales bacterium]
MKTSQTHLPSFFSSILFILGGLFLLSIALLMGITAFASLVMGTEVQPQQTIFLIAFGFEGILLFAAAFFAMQKYLQKESADQPVSHSTSFLQIILLVLLAGASILIGYFIAGTDIVNWLFLPLLTIPAIVLPLGVLLALGTRRLPFSTRWQTWTVLGLAMTLGPFLLFVLEIIIAILIFVGVVAYIMTQPELVSELQLLSEQIMILGPQSEEAVELLSPFLTNPAVIAIALLYIAVLVPAIEEIFKPIGVWLFASKLESPAQGFTLGALSGAGYALIETIGVSGQQTGEWATLLFTRIGTGLLHITTSAIMGAAIVLAWRERRYLRLLGSYLLAVSLHGLWNALAMVFTFSTLATFLEQPGRLRALQPVMVIALAGLVIVLLAILTLANRRLRGTISPPLVEPTVPPTDTETGEIM